MNKMEELLNMMCPDGVEYNTIASCVSKVDKIKWQEENDNIYEYIDLSSVDRDFHKIIETTKINKENAPSRAQQIVQKGDIIFGSTRPLLKRYCQIDDTYNGQICSTGFTVLRAKEDRILDRWLFHNISTTRFYEYVEKHQQGASYPSITDKDVKNYRIPVPPIKVQEKIIRILDEFSEASNQLYEKLQEEIIARQKQYEYYRDRLLTFPKKK